MSKEIADRVRTLVEPVVRDEGMELVDVEYRREAHGWVLRLIIDKERGVALNDCSRISQEVGRILDVEDFIVAPYHLEVSSPGLNRPLKNTKDFLRHRNQVIKVRTFSQIVNRRQFKGKLLDVVEDQIQMEIDGEIVQIPLSNVAKANLEFEL